MSMKYSIPEIILVLIIDIVLFITVDDWNESKIITLAAINASLIICLTFMLVSANGTNSDIFRISTGLLGGIMLLIEVVLSALILWLEPSLIITALSQAVLLIVTEVLLATNHSLNVRASRSDAKTKSGMATFESIKDNLRDSMDICDVRTRSTVESTLDAICAMTSPGDEKVESLDLELYNLSNQVRWAAEDANEEDVGKICAEMLKITKKRERVVRNR